VKNAVLRAHKSFHNLLNNKGFRCAAVTVWALVVLTALYLYFFQRSFVQSHLQSIFAISIFIGYSAYLILGSLRGFTLIPSTYLIFLGIPFFSPAPLFALTLVGILISSSCIYFLSDSMHFYDFFQIKYGRKVDRIKSLVQKNELPIVIGWSFFPLAPTDLICYICGILEVDIKKFLLGVFIGEGTISAVYIFFGNYILRFLHLKP